MLNFWSDDIKTVLPEFADAYNRIRIRETAYPSRDTLVDARPDFIYAAYKSAFSDDLPGMREVLEAGAGSYLSPSDCEKRAPSSSQSTEMVFDEIRDIARIFGVMPRAEQLIAGYRAELATIGDRIGPVSSPKRVFWWDSGLPPYVAGCCGTPNEILRLSGGENIFPDLRGTWGTVSWKDVIERNPEVIVLVDAGWAPAAQKRELLLTNAAFAGIDAVRNQRFVTVTFSDATPGVRNIAAVRKVAQALYPDKFAAPNLASN